LSVIAVIWHHTLGHQSGLPTWMGAGYHGVTLFFAISGFLIVTLLLREHESRGFIDLRAFYIRRALRIFPLYFAILALYIVLVASIERESPAGREFFKNLLSYATYTSNWFVTLDGRVIFYFAWSLAAEEQFYLLWPSMERFVRPARAVGVMALVIAIVAILLWVGPPAGGPVPLWFRMATSIQLAICFGVVLAHLLHDERSYLWLKWLLGWRASGVVFLLAALWLSSWNEPSEIAVHLAFALAVGACVYREDHLLAPFLKWRIVSHLGSVSYGMYLLHMLVKNSLGKGLSYAGLGDSPYLLFLLTVAATAVVATLSFRYFESFFLRLKATYSAPK
uniref:acyltransferase family protein n=1 Tax=Piscinibacter sp. TaxID=1903157 RepID=UPI00355984CF